MVIFAALGQLRIKYCVPLIHEGQDPGPGAKYYVGYPAGATAFFQYIKAWRERGELR